MGNVSGTARSIPSPTAPAKLGVTDANGNSEALELPDAEYIYGVCENGDTLAVLAGAAPLFFAGTGDEQTRERPIMRFISTTKPGN